MVNQVVNLVVNQVVNKYLHTYDTSSLSPNPYPIAMAPQRWMLLMQEAMTHLLQRRMNAQRQEKESEFVR